MLISGSSNPQIIGENGNHVTLIENVLDNNLPQSFTIKLTVNSICGISEILQVIDLSADCRDHQIIDGCTETISQKKTTVQFNEIFNESTNPVIITGPITNNDVGQFSSIVTNKTSQEFDIQSLSWDGSPIITGDQISYLYGEESILKFGEFKAQFGVATSIGIIENYVTFLQEFDETPIVFLTPNSGIEDQVFKVDIHSVSKEGFYFKTNFKEQELPNYNVEIGFIAAEPGFGYVNEKLIYVGEVNKSDSTNWTTLEFGEYFNTTPLIFLSAQSSTENNVGGFRITNLDENHFDFSINSIPSVSNIVKDKVGFILLENNVSCNCDLNFSFNQEIKPVTCGEDNNGSIVLNPTGGLSPYNIYWDDGNTGNTLDNLKGGEYFVQVMIEMVAILI